MEPELNLGKLTKGRRPPILITYATSAWALCFLRGERIEIDELRIVLLGFADDPPLP